MMARQTNFKVIELNNYPNRYSRRRFAWGFVLLFALCVTSAFATTPLPAQRAFVLSTMVLPTIKVSKSSADEMVMVRATWQITLDHFLYRDQITVRLADNTDEMTAIGVVQFPTGMMHTDALSQQYPIYRDQVAINIPIVYPQQSIITLDISYQGCSDAGHCYPPITQRVSLDLQQPGVAIQGHVQPSSVLSTVDELVNPQAIWLTLMSFIGLGLLLAFTPCVLPMIPILSGIIIGHGTQLTTFKGFLLSLSYVLGMSLTYAVFGIVITTAGYNLQVLLQTPWVIGLFSLLFIGLALSMFGLFELRLPRAIEQILHMLSYRQRSGTYLGAFVMGSIATLLVSPCVSAPLVGALAYISKTGDITLGALTLFCLGLGMGLPLLLLGISGGKYLPRSGHWTRRINALFGFLLLAVAVYLVERLLPSVIAMSLWAMLCIMIGIYLISLTLPHLQARIISKTIGLISIGLAVLIFIGGMLGNTSPLKPLANLHYTARHGWQLTTNSLSFINIKTVNDLKQQLQLARTQHKAVMLDIYADWCIACKVIERDVFTHPAVIDALQSFVLLQADVTVNNAADRALLKAYDIIAPPTILFFDKNGTELIATRIIGEINAQQFLQHIASVSSSNAD